MQFNHFGLPVRDARRSLPFYPEYFGFDPPAAQEHPDGTVIVRNADGFYLALTHLSTWSRRPRSCMPDPG